MTTRIVLRPMRLAQVLAVAAGVAGALSLWSIVSAAQVAFAAFMVLLAVVSWRRARCWVDVAPDGGLTIHHTSLARPAHVPPGAVGAVTVGDALDVAWESTLPRTTLRHDATLVLHLVAPVELRFGFGPPRQTARTALALVAVDPVAAGDVLRALGLPVTVEARAAPAVRARRRRRRHRAAAVAVLAPLLIVGAKAAGEAFKMHRGEARWRAEHDPDGRWRLPAWPSARASFAGTAADGSQLRAWRVSATTLRVRIDVSAAPCSGAAWREVWHATDFPALRLGADGTYRGRLRRVVALDGGIDLVTATVSGRLRAGRLSAALTRDDDYRGWPDSGVCHRTLELVAPPST